MLLVAAVIVAAFVVPLPSVHLGGGAATPSTVARGAGGHHPVTVTACTTTVRGVVPGPATVTVGFLPPGFRLTSGDPADLGDGPVTYSSATGRTDPPRVAINLSNDPGPLTASVGGRATATSVTVQGHRGLLESGPPSPQFIGVYWKIDSTDLVSVVGYEVDASTVLRVARHVDVTPAAVIPLPISPGRIVDRATAVSVARQSVPAPADHFAAKLSSWTEVLALIKSSDYGQGLSRVPSTLASPPWEPVWAVSATGAGSAATLVVIDAGSGHEELTLPEGDHPSWFGALTDRDPSLHGGCPGGSSARLPFGVLTRDEETYTLRDAPYSGVEDLRVTVILKLTTVPALNRADPGLYGGCVQQSCSLDELVWPTIEVLRPLPGKHLTCPPPWVSTPFSSHGKPTTQYFSIGVPDNDESGCGALPAWVSHLQDLAPPAR